LTAFNNPVRSRSWSRRPRASETAVYWNDTKASGDEMKEGAMVHWAGAEMDRRMWATRVHVGAMPKKM
jgi:hypothetical protein